LTHVASNRTGIMVRLFYSKKPRSLRKAWQLSLEQDILNAPVIENSKSIRNRQNASNDTDLA
jgi:hypothetical protein